MNFGTQRLLQQGVGPAAFTQPADVVRWMGALQAQDYAQGLWAIGVRLRDGTRAQVEAAIAERQIVRTWPMRGTLHFVPAEDTKWMVDFTESRMLRQVRGRLARLELDDATLARSRDVLANALSGGRQLTRAACLASLEAAGIKADGQRGYHMLWHASQTGVICLGPMAGKEQTFVLLDEWVPHPRRLAGDEALAELARRYFTSHGPATAEDFAWWAGLTLTDARRGLASVAGELCALDRDGTRFWHADSRPGANAQALSSGLLLPGFDEFLLGYRNRAAVLTPEHADRVVPGGNGMFKAMVVADGQIVGTWRSVARKQGLTVAASCFVPGLAPEALHEPARRFADFRGEPLASVTLEALAQG